MKCKCENGWLEIDDEWRLCRRCSADTVGRYIRQIQDLLGLGSWTIEIQDIPADEGTIAEVSVTLGQTHALLYLCETWRDLDAETQRDTLVHEMLHLHMARMRATVSSVCAELGDKVGRVAESVLNLEEEYAVESIAQVISKYFPLPGGKR